MSTVHYSDEHIYIRPEGNIGVVGISKYAQEQLINVVYVELPEVGKVVNVGEEAGLVESAKAANEVYSPVSGEVLDVNSSLEDNSAPINDDPEGAAWIMKIKMSNPGELEKLMSSDAYSEFISSLE